MKPRAFLRDSIAVAASSYFARAVLIARGIVAAAALGPHGYGGWNALNLIYDYGYYASLGSLQGLDLQLPAAAGQDPARARGLMAGAWSVTLIGGLAFGALLGLYLATGGRAFGAWSNVELPLLMLVAAWLQIAFQYLASSLRAYGRFQAVSLGGAVQALIGGGLGLALVWRHGIWGLLVGWNAGAILALVVMGRSIPEAPLRPASFPTGASLARLGLPIFLYFGATTLLRSIDRWALLSFGGPEALGLYGIGLMAFGLALYLPESAAFVLFPRIAATFHGTRDPARTRDECVRAQRVLAAVMPVAVGLGMIWSGPLVDRLLPDYRGGLGALRVLAVGAAMYSAGTVPGYYLLGATRFRALLGIAAAANLVTAAAVVGVAARHPSPTPVAFAAASGHTLFAAAVLWTAAREWFATSRERVAALAAGLVPGAWVAGSWFLIRRIGDDASPSAAALRTLAFAALYLPMLAWLLRGVGLRALLARRTTDG